MRSYRIKIDPGAKHTGLCIVCNETNEVVFFMQIEHRGDAVKENLDTRRVARKNKRARETRYRRCKYKGGRECDSSREEGWLPPSVRSTADNIINWVNKLKRWINLTECSFEAVRFDSQLMNDPDIEGEEYQHGTLFGYELREYLLEKYGHTCQYCGGRSGDDALEWEHIVPKGGGHHGSDSVKNATLACNSCNDDKGCRTPDEWKRSILAKPVRTELDEERLKGIDTVNKRIPRRSDRYSAWVNSSRRYTERNLFQIFGSVECSSGGRTKYNRVNILELPKDHHFDALCVGNIPEDGYKDLTCGYVFMVKATGRGSRLRGNINKCGVITVKYKDRSKTHKGFMTGDIVKANIPNGKYAGIYTGRITIRHKDSFKLKPFGSKAFDVNIKYITILQKADGYEYSYQRKAF